MTGSKVAHQRFDGYICIKHLNICVAFQPDDCVGRQTITLKWTLVKSKKFKTAMPSKEGLKTAEGFPRLPQSPPWRLIRLLIEQFYIIRSGQLINHGIEGWKVIVNSLCVEVLSPLELKNLDKVIVSGAHPGSLVENNLSIGNMYVIEDRKVIRTTV